jgi:hypothetical protein
MNRPRILITGSRDWADAQTIMDELLIVRERYATSRPILVHGACSTGADDLAHWIGHELGFALEPHPADWDGPCGDSCPKKHRKTARFGSTYCPRAGVIRNSNMVRMGADLCLAFIANASPGATMTASMAENAGIPTIRRIRTTAAAL